MSTTSITPTYSVVGRGLTDLGLGGARKKKVESRPINESPRITSPVPRSGPKNPFARISKVVRGPGLRGRVAHRSLAPLPMQQIL